MVNTDDDRSNRSRNRSRSPHSRSDRERDSRKTKTSSSSHHQHKRSHDDDRRGSSPPRRSHRDEDHRKHHSRREEERRPPSFPVKIKEEPMSDSERPSSRDRRPTVPDERRERPRADGDFQPPRQKPRRKSPRSEDAEAANYQYGLQVKEEKEEEGPPVEKQKPNFGLSGKLTEETNVFNGVVVKYSEPPEARIPKRRWRFYVFKGEEALPTLYLHRQSAYLMGRDRKVADIPVDHPSCSKQHAVLQFRLVNYERPDGSSGRTVRPYIIDLEAANGTFVNNQKIEPKRYVELFEKDVLKFGFSSREYVLLHEESKAEASLDDLGQ